MMSFACRVAPVAALLSFAVLPGAPASAAGPLAPSAAPAAAPVQSAVIPVQHKGSFGGGGGGGRSVGGGGGGRAFSGGSRSFSGGRSSGGRSYSYSRRSGSPFAGRAMPRSWTGNLASRGRHHGRRHGHGFRGYYGYGYGYDPYYYYGDSYAYPSCAWLRRRAVTTGSHYWWRRYRSCVANYY